MITVKKNMTLRGLLILPAVFLLAACNNSSEPDNTIAIFGDPVAQIANLEDDILIPPSVPELDIQYQNGALEFSWETEPDLSQINIFSYNSLTQSDALLTGDVSTQSTTYVHEFEPLRAAIDHLQFRIELCTVDHCVSSFYTDLPPITSSLVSIDNDDINIGWRPFLNQHGDILVLLSEDASTAGIYYKADSGWIYTGSIDGTGLRRSSNAIVDVALSEYADTFAVATHEPASMETHISIYERLGEAWFETSQWTESAPASDLAPSVNLIEMDQAAQNLITITGDGFARYKREGFDFKLSQTIFANDPAITWDTAHNVGVVSWLSQQADGSQSIHRADADGTISSVLLSDALPNLFAFSAQIQSSNDGDNFIIAAWQRVDERLFQAKMFYGLIVDNAWHSLSSQVLSEPAAIPSTIVLDSSEELSLNTVSWQEHAQQGTQLLYIQDDLLNKSLSLTPADASLGPVKFSVSGDGSVLAWGNREIETLD